MEKVGNKHCVSPVQTNFPENVQPSKFNSRH